MTLRVVFQVIGWWVLQHPRRQLNLKKSTETPSEAAPSATVFYVRSVRATHTSFNPRNVDQPASARCVV